MAVPVHKAHHQIYYDLRNVSRKIKTAATDLVRRMWHECLVIRAVYFSSPEVLQTARKYIWFESRNINSRVSNSIKNSKSNSKGFQL